MRKRKWTIFDALKIILIVVVAFAITIAVERFLLPDGFLGRFESIVRMFMVIVLAILGTWLTYRPRR